MVIKRFMDIQGPILSEEDENKHIWKTILIDSPLDAHGDYIYDYKEKYFVKGRPNPFLKPILLEMIKHYDFNKDLS